MSPSSSPHWPNTPSPLTEVVLDTSCVLMPMPGPYGDQPPPRDRPGRPLRAGVPDRRPPATPPQRHPGRRRRAGAHRADSTGRENGAPDQRGDPRRLPPGHLLSRQAVLFHPGLAGDRRRVGDHGAPRSPAGDPAHHPQRRHPYAAAAPRFWAGPPGILHPCPGDGLGADRRLRRARTGRQRVAGGSLRRGGHPRGNDQPAHHGHPDHSLGGLVRRCQHAAGRGPGPPDGDVRP